MKLLYISGIQYISGSIFCRSLSLSLCLSVAISLYLSIFLCVSVSPCVSQSLYLAVSLLFIMLLEFWFGSSWKQDRTYDFQLEFDTRIISSLGQWYPENNIVLCGFVWLSFSK